MMSVKKMMAPAHLMAGVMMLSFALLAAPANHAQRSGQVFAQAPVQDDGQSPPRLRILVTGDDGVDAPGLHALAEELAKLGEVIVCAPDGNRSGASHSMRVLSEPLRVEQRQIPGATAACAVSGTPADAVTFGIVHLGRDAPFDLVVSGVNAGSNVGAVSHMSGTVGGAMEAARLGVPAIAVSGPRDGFDLAARFTARFVTRLREEAGLTPGVVYSINVPANDPAQVQGVAATSMGTSYFEIDSFTMRPAEDGSQSYRARARQIGSPGDDSDTARFLDGWITITPLRFDWTDRDALESLHAWGEITLQE